MLCILKDADLDVSCFFNLAVSSPVISCSRLKWLTSLSISLNDSYYCVVVLNFSPFEHVKYKKSFQSTESEEKKDDEKEEEKSDDKVEKKEDKKEEKVSF